MTSIAIVGNARSTGSLLTKELLERGFDAICFAPLDLVNDNRFVNTFGFRDRRPIVDLAKAALWTVVKRAKRFDLELRNFGSTIGLRSRNWIPWYHGVELFDMPAKTRGFVSTLDLLEHSPSGSVLLPRCVDFEPCKQARTLKLKHRSDLIKVGHFWRRGIPFHDFAYRWFKGSDVFYEAVELLKQQGYVIEVVDGFVPHANFPAVLAGLDVLAEQFRFGYYGLPALESLVVGTPVVGYYTRQLAECADVFDNLVPCGKSPESVAAAILRARDFRIGSTLAIERFHSVSHTADIFLDQVGKWGLL